MKGEEEGDEKGWKNSEHHAGVTLSDGWLGARVLTCCAI